MSATAQRAATPAQRTARRPVYRNPALLRPHPNNARTHSPAQIDQLVASIRRFGFTMPVLIDEADMILVGHGRSVAAVKLGLKEVPCFVATGWTEAEKRAYMIADNRLALNAGWDNAVLAEEVAALKGGAFDLSLLGFGDAELAKMLSESEAALFGAGADTVPAPEANPVRAATAPLPDRFWISVKGPLELQADALSRLKAAMADLGMVEVTLGTARVGAN
jgi:ParB-like chromosome segregation protein Spo0J